VQDEKDNHFTREWGSEENGQAWREWRASQIDASFPKQKQKLEQRIAEGEPVDQQSSALETDGLWRKKRWAMKKEKGKLLDATKLGEQAEKRVNIHITFPQK